MYSYLVQTHPNNMPLNRAERAFVEWKELVEPEGANKIWGDVKIMGPFWVPIVIRPLIFRVPKKGP